MCHCLWDLGSGCLCRMPCGGGRMWFRGRMARRRGRLGMLFSSSSGARLVGSPSFANVLSHVSTDLACARRDCGRMEFMRAHGALHKLVRGCQDDLVTARTFGSNVLPNLLHERRHPRVDCSSHLFHRFFECRSRSSSSGRGLLRHITLMVSMRRHGMNGDPTDPAGYMVLYLYALPRVTSR